WELARASSSTGNTGPVSWPASAPSTYQTATVSPTVVRAPTTNEPFVGSRTPWKSDKGMATPALSLRNISAAMTGTHGCSARTSSTTDGSEEQAAELTTSKANKPRV